LAMAVQVICYEVRMLYLKGLEEGSAAPQLRAMTRPGDEGWDVPLAPVSDVEGFFTHLEQVLVEVEFHRRDKPRQLMTRLRRLFLRAGMDQMEINILRGILTSVQKAAGTLPGKVASGEMTEHSGGQEQDHV
ncbi:MAG: tRNA (cytosine(32)/uridine(32)-2'-O)-methyltransferase TrmJ, partial [Pseudomonadota bacterium]|nr:tRNA (cytosine(32)/uridine(32)-2'-O)-methyltransferase TrmJ [Pseudomonadota bacterium]